MTWALVIAASTATAGTIDDPELRDEVEDAGPLALGASHDIVAAWFNESNNSVAVTLLVTDLTEVFAGSRYEVAWSEGPNQRGVFVEINVDGSFYGGYGARNGSGRMQTDNVDIDRSVPGRIDWHIQRVSMVANGGDSLRNITASSRGPGDLRAPALVQDDASADRDFPLVSTYVPVYGSPGPGMVLAVGSLALASFLLGSSRSDRR